MNRPSNELSPSLALGLCALGAACAMGAYVAGVSLASILSEGLSSNYPELVAASWQPVRDRLLLHLWTDGHSITRDLAVSIGALSALWVLGRKPVISLPIHRVDPLDDEF